MVPWCDRLGRLPRRSSCRMDNQNGNVQNAKTVEFLVSAASCCDARLRTRLLCLSGHDLFPTIILCVHPFFRQQTYYILSHLRALSCSYLKYRQSNCMSALTWAQTPLCKALQQRETFETVQKKRCVVLQTRGNSTSHES